MPTSYRVIILLSVVGIDSARVLNDMRVKHLTEEHETDEQGLQGGLEMEGCVHVYCIHQIDVAIPSRSYSLRDD